MSKINRLEFKQLRILDALLKERNLSKVAANIGLTQQAVSEHLKKLRIVFDDPLFVRTSNGVLPTPIAENLQPQVIEILARINQLVEPPDFDPSTLNTVFRISASDYSQCTILPELVAKLRYQAPGLRVLVNELAIDTLPLLLSSGDVDLALTVPEFTPDNYPTQHLFHEDYVCVACANSSIDAQLDMQTLAEQAFMIVSPARASFRGSADKWFEQHGFERNVVMAVPGFAAVPACLKYTELLAFLPTRMLPDPRIKTINLIDTPPGFEAIATWHARSHQDPLHKWIRALLGEQTRTLE